MAYIPSVNKKKYEANIEFYKKQKNITFFSLIIIEIVFLIFIILGFTVLPRVVAGLALTHFIVFPFLFPHNFKFFMELKYFGVKDSFSIVSFLFHLFLLLAIECCLVFISLFFLEEAPRWIIISGLALFMTLIVTLFIEKKSYSELYNKLNFERGLYK